MRQLYPDMRPNYSDVGQHYPDMRQNYQDMRQNHPDMRQNHQDMRPHHQDMRQNHPDMRQNHPDTRQNHPDMRQNYQDMRQVTGYLKSPGEVNQSSERQDVIPAGPDRHHRDPAHYSPYWQPGQQPPVIQRNTVVKRNDNFLDSSLPSPTCDPTQRRSVSRPSSRGPDLGRQQSRDSLSARSLTLPARVRYSQDSDSDNSPRSRTSKSGLHEESCPVPPSPSPAQHNMIDNNVSNPSISPQKDDWSHQNSRGNIHNMSFSSRHFILHSAEC